MDTPGFSSLYLTDMEEQDLKDYFPEFRKYDENADFRDAGIFMNRDAE